MENKQLLIFLRIGVQFSPAVLDSLAGPWLDGPVPPLREWLPASLPPIWRPPRRPVSVHAPAARPSASAPAGLKTHARFHLKCNHQHILNMSLGLTVEGGDGLMVTHL